MTEQGEILFMQTRVIRLAAKRWNSSVQRVGEMFDRYGILKLIEDSYDIFHTEGDEVVLQEIEEFLKSREIDFQEVDPTQPDMDQTGEVTQQQKEFAIDATAALVVEDLAGEMHKEPSKVLAEFLASRTGALLYDEESKIWCAGPAYIEDLYREEQEKRDR